MNEEMEILIKRVKGSRSMRLKIGRDGHPVLTLPYWVPKKIGLLWAQKQQQWIQKNTFVPNLFHDGQKILFLGREISIQYVATKMRTHIEGDVLQVGGDKAFLPRRVGDFIKKEFLPFLHQKVLEKEELLGVKHTRLTLRDTNSRWGSCSSSGTLSFCWRLAMTPEFVIDYLVAHEVAHLKHMNHGEHFWKTVSMLTTHTFQAKKWLKQNGQSLPMIK